MLRGIGSLNQTAATVVRGNYSEIDEIFERLGISGADGILMDLGVYISGIRFYGAKDSEDVLQDGTNAMHDQRTRNR